MVLASKVAAGHNVFGMMPVGVRMFMNRISAGKPADYRSGCAAFAISLIRLLLPIVAACWFSTVWAATTPTSCMASEYQNMVRLNEFKSQGYGSGVDFVEIRVIGTDVNLSGWKIEVYGCQGGNSGCDNKTNMISIELGKGYGCVNDADLSCSTNKDSAGYTYSNPTYIIYNLPNMNQKSAQFVLFAPGGGVADMLSYSNDNSCTHPHWEPPPAGSACYADTPNLVTCEKNFEANEGNMQRIPDGNGPWVQPDRCKGNNSDTCKDPTPGRTNDDVPPNVTAAGFNAVDVGADPVTGKIKTKVAGVAFNLDVVALDKDGSAVDTSFTNTVQVDLLANTTASVKLDSNNCPDISTSTAVGNVIDVPLVNGKASAVSMGAIEKAWRDVRVRIRYTAVGKSTITACSTDRFAIRPGAVKLSTNATAEPPSATATPIIKAGASFTVTATTSTAPGDGYAGTLFRDSSKLSVSNPSVGNNNLGILNPTSLIANQSPAPSGNASYTEVGYVNVNAGAYQDTTFTAVDQASDCVMGSVSVTPDSSGKVGCYIGNETVSFGRFVPDHFALDTVRSTITPACASGGFSYMYQPFGVKAVLEARNQGGTKTANYSGDFAKGAPQFAAENNNSGVDLLNRFDGLSGGSWSSGEFTLNNSTIKFKRNTPPDTTPDGAFDSLQIGVKISDENGLVLLKDLDMNPADTTNCSGASNCTHKSIGNTKIRYGRLRLSNIFGSRNSTLEMTVQAQYWSGKTWLLNNVDNCTSLSANAFALSGDLASGVTALVKAVLSDSPSSQMTLSGGKGFVVLSKSSDNATGSVDVAANLSVSDVNNNSCLGSIGGTAANKPWLRSRNGDCAATYDKDPSARATFGVYAPETRKTVHVRELY